MRRLASILAAPVLLSAAPAQYDCQTSIQSYNTAISDIGSTNSRFLSCVEYSRGQDDCSMEFRRLRNAHSEFESAVSGYRSYCND